MCGQALYYIYQQRRKQMTKRNEFTRKTKAAIRAKGDCCWACGLPGWVGIEVDHIIPRNHKDSHNGEDNGQMLCSACNNVKADTVIAVAPRKPLWIEDQRKMSQQVHANRNKFRRMVLRARERA
jgi:5-methylcytosine-specific restriction endonuclease McrA